MELCREFLGNLASREKLPAVVRFRPSTQTQGCYCASWLMELGQISRMLRDGVPSEPRGKRGPSNSLRGGVRWVMAIGGADDSIGRTRSCPSVGRRRLGQGCPKGTAEGGRRALTRLALSDTHHVACVAAQQPACAATQGEASRWHESTRRQLSERLNS